MALQRVALERRARRSRPSAATCGCSRALLLRERRLGYERWLRSICTPEQVEREAFVECPVAHPTLLIRRAVLLEFGYRDRGWPEDYDLVLRLLQSGRRIGVVPQRLLHWRDSAARLSRTSESYSIAAFVECKAEFLASGFLAASERYLLWGFGDTGKALANALARRGKHPEAIIELHPGRIGQLIRGVPVVAPSALPGLRSRARTADRLGRGLGPRTEIRQALSHGLPRIARLRVCRVNGRRSRARLTPRGARQRVAVPREPGGRLRAWLRRRATARSTPRRPPA